jgi:hypothetical protein
MSLQGFAACRLPSIVVDDGVSQQPIEPSDHAFLIADFASFLYSSHERVLEDFFRLFAASDAGGKKIKESAVVR